jgi:hypothetical protein
MRSGARFGGVYAARASERAVKWLSSIFLLSSLGFLCASFVAGLEYSHWTVAAVLGLWSLCTGLYAADAAGGVQE